MPRVRRRRRLALASCAALLGVAFLACGSRLDPRLVQHWAANDFTCDDRLIEVERVSDPARYRARGCGHSRIYDCVERADGTIKCTPVAEVAGNAGTTTGAELPPGSGCDCSHPHSTDEPSSSPNSTTPVMPQKPYRQ